MGQGPSAVSDMSSRGSSEARALPPGASLQQKAVAFLEPARWPCFPRGHLRRPVPAVTASLGWHHARRDAALLPAWFWGLRSQRGIAALAAGLLGAARGPATVSEHRRGGVPAADSAHDVSPRGKREGRAPDWA